MSDQEDILHADAENSREQEMFVENFVENHQDIAIQLLIEWGLLELTNDFIENQIEIEILKHITINDINDLIPVEKLGLRVKFRQKVFAWRRRNGMCTPLADTISAKSDDSSFCISVQDESDLNEPNSEDTLSDLLNVSLKRKTILEEYKSNNFLSHQNRNDLCTIIVDSRLNKGYKYIANGTYTKTAENIVSLFPSECVEVYIDKDKKENGELVQRFYSVCRKFREKGVLNSRYKNKRSRVEDTENVVSKLRKEETSSVSPDIIWLRHNRQPEQKVLYKWNKTHKLRMKHIDDENTNIFVEWPILKQQIGSTLIGIDFEILYRGKDVLLFTKWKTFCESVKDIYHKSLKDATSLDLLKDLGNSTQKDITDYICSILLCSLLPSAIIHSKNPKKSWIPTILETQHHFISLIKEEVNISEAIEQHRTNLLQKGLSNQPFIIAVGSTHTTISSIYVSFQDHLYSAESILNAISLAFKIFYVFKVQYPGPCKLVWQLIQEHIYEIPIKGKKTSCLFTLLTKLKSTK